MDLPPDLAVIHQPSRLRIMALLWRRRDVAFTAARDALGLTDGNLATHLRRLEDAGLAVSRRVLVHDRFEVRVRITDDGLRRFRMYLAVMRRFLESADG